MLRLQKGFQLLVTVGFFCCLLLSACTTGEKFAQLHPGMPKAQVISLLGNPKGYEQNGDYETLQYPGALISGWPYDTADFYVTLHKGLVEKYGASNVQKAQRPAVILVAPPPKL